MSGFSFPPPPPPPPKTTQPQQPSNSNRGQPHGRGTNRGGRGRQGMAETWRRNQHPPHVPKQAECSHQGARTSESRQPQSATVYSQHAGLNNRQGGLPGQNVPPGPFLNPNFGASEYGMNHDRNSPASLSSGYENHQFFQRQDNQNHNSPPRTVAGHKRKLEALRGPDRQNKPAPPTAPAIPSFGAALLPPKPSFSASARPTKQRSSSQAKSSGRSLGLVPQSEDVQYSSSGSDDEGDLDEESAHSELGNKLTFEHNGIIMSLNSQADLAAWKKERKRNWPTSRRMAEKYEERKKIGEERKRLLESARILQRPSRRLGMELPGNVKNNGQTSNPSEESIDRPTATTSNKPETEFEQARREVSEQSKRLEELRRKVAESEARNRAARAQKEGAEARAIEKTSVTNEPGDRDVIEPDLADQDRDEASQMDEDGLEAEPEQKSVDNNELVDASQELSSDSSSSLDSDEDSPEEVTSKPIAAEESNKVAIVCKYFAASGHCRDGDACRFKHETSTNAVARSNTVLLRPQNRNSSSQNTKSDRSVQRKGIYEMLLEQDREEEDRLALKVIKYLGRAGFFKETPSLEAT